MRVSVFPLYAVLHQSSDLPSSILHVHLCVFHTYHTSGKWIKIICPRVLLLTTSTATLVSACTQDRLMPTSPLKDGAGNPWATGGTGDHGGVRIRIYSAASVSPLPNDADQNAVQCPCSAINDHRTTGISTNHDLNVGHRFKIDYHYSNGGGGSPWAAGNQRNMHAGVVSKVDHVLAASVYYSVGGGDTCLCSLFGRSTLVAATAIQPTLR